MRAVKRSALALVLALAVGACTSDDGTPTGGPSTTGQTTTTAVVPTTAEPSTTSLVEAAQGVWVDASGAVAADGSPQDGLTINVSPGAGHCDWQDALVMLLAVPVGSVRTTFDGVHQYVRDPATVISSGGVVLQSDLDTQSELPPTADFTGLSTGDVELWVDPAQLE